MARSGLTAARASAAAAGDKRTLVRLDLRVEEGAGDIRRVRSVKGLASRGSACGEIDFPSPRCSVPSTLSTVSVASITKGAVFAVPSFTWSFTTAHLSGCFAVFLPRSVTASAASRPRISTRSALACPPWAANRIWPFDEPRSFAGVAAAGEPDAAVQHSERGLGLLQRRNEARKSQAADIEGHARRLGRLARIERDPALDRAAREADGERVEV